MTVHLFSLSVLPEYMKQVDTGFSTSLFVVEKGVDFWVVVLLYLDVVGLKFLFSVSPWLFIVQFTVLWLPIEFFSFLAAFRSRFLGYYLTSVKIYYG